jgi:hypothetical protein
MTMKKGLQRFLLTLSVRGGYMHAYLISDGGQDTLKRITGHMLSLAEEMGAATQLSGLVMVTKLDKGTTQKMETYLGKVNQEIADLLETVDDFHVSVWTTPEGSDSDWLLKLH